MTNASLPKFALLTDAPPFKEGGHGCHLLSWNWLHAVGHDVRIVVTRRLNGALSVERITAALPKPVVFYPDLSRLRWPGCLTALKSLAELFLFLLWSPKIAQAIRASGAERIFAFFGGNTWFLFVARCVEAMTGLPLDVYLVEDLEASTRINGHPGIARIARWFEPRLLRRASRIFAISPGFAEHLAAKYAVRTSWLPIAVASEPIQYRQFVPAQPDVRCITFIGGINPVNEDVLRDVLHAVEDWNASARPFQLRLLLMIYTDPAYLDGVLPKTRHIEVLCRPPRQQLEQRLRESWVLLIPYSFSADMRTMVSTAFPTKLADTLPTGRPVLVYGPPYASVPRYFLENRLPLCVTSPLQLRAALAEVERQDTVMLTKQYEAVLQRFHSPQNIRKILEVRNKA